MAEPYKSDTNDERGEFYFVTTAHRKSAYVKAAKPGKVVAWMLKVCDAACDYTPPNAPGVADRKSPPV